MKKASVFRPRLKRLLGAPPLALQAGVQFFFREQQAPESWHWLETTALDQAVDGLDARPPLTVHTPQVNRRLDGGQIRANDIRLRIHVANPSPPAAGASSSAPRLPHNA